MCCSRGSYSRFKVVVTNCKPRCPCQDHCQTHCQSDRQNIGQCECTGLLHIIRVPRRVVNIDL
ncbi:hypothetical protein BKA56DRAFT_569919 [Ilyonectria sp. MPI-CAGE-AT-0026]|nr:hypothetical protein BKA56DRAFT_569919 [Ilyonectria sp. MPI-CAGE-AT-0026]